MTILTQLWKHRLGVVALAVLLLLALAHRQQQEIIRLRVELETRPVVVERVEIDRAVEVVRAPSKVFRKVVTKVDGTKIETERKTIGAMQRKLVEHVARDRQEKPQPVSAGAALRPPTRYVGVGSDLGYALREAWSVRAGLTFFNRFDVGYRFSRRGNVHGLEVGVRF